MMQSIRSYIYGAGFLFLCIFVSACCKRDESAGDIVSDINIDNLGNLACYKLPEQLCIRDDSTFQAIFKLTSSNTGCDTIHLPVVDFSKNSVLLYLKSSADNRHFQRQVTIDNDSKAVHYVINSSKCYCADKCETISLNMVLVTKIPADYKVEFQ